MERIALLDGDAREQALAALDVELVERLGDLPEIFASRVEPLPAAAHVWACFHDLEAMRQVTMVPVGLGAMIPLRGALPWAQVGAWMDERGIRDSVERHQVRGLLRAMEGEFQRHQADSLKNTAKGEGGPNAGEVEGEDG